MGLLHMNALLTQRDDLDRRTALEHAGEEEDEEEEQHPLRLSKRASKVRAARDSWRVDKC